MSKKKVVDSTHKETPKGPMPLGSIWSNQSDEASKKRDVVDVKSENTFTPTQLFKHGCDKQIEGYEMTSTLFHGVWRDSRS